MFQRGALQEESTDSPSALAGAHLALPSVSHSPGLKLTWMETTEFWRQVGWGVGRGLDSWSRRDPVEEENEDQGAERWVTGPQVVGQEE